jgi:hypothetical protein
MNVNIISQIARKQLLIYILSNSQMELNQPKVISVKVVKDISKVLMMERLKTIERR